MRQSIAVAMLVAAGFVAPDIRASQDQPAPPAAGDFAKAASTLSDAHRFLRAKHDEYVACEDKVRESEAFQPISRRIPRFGSEPTAAQFSDRSLITPGEAHAMSACAPKFRACRSITEEAEASLLPALGPLAKDYEAQHEAVVSDLIARKLTWGAYFKAQAEVNERRKARRAGILAAVKGDAATSAAQALK